jgi:hypothetical protein
MADRDDVLRANADFYRAFAERDMVLMEAVWAESAPVACIHPGWAPLTERAAVLESWQRILANPDQPTLECLQPRAFLQGDAAFVLCYEKVGAEFLVATNLFLRERGRWRLVHHQSGPVAEIPVPTRPSTRLH